MLPFRLALPSRRHRAAPLAAALLALAALAAPPVRAGLPCEPAATAAEPAGAPCRLGLPADLLAALAQPQRASQWCWAASVSMLLGRYGLRVPQEDVVRAWYGSAVNVGVGQAALGELLRRTWRDGRGRGVRTHYAAVPPTPAGLAHPAVLAELAGGRPVLVGVRGHAVLLVAVEVTRERGGAPRLLRATVLDPALAGGLRTLAADEAEFVATVDVRPLVEGVPEPQLAAR